MQTNQKDTESKDNGELAADGQRAHLHESLKEFVMMMVATYDKKGKHPRIHARPMMVAKVEDDCSLIFVVKLDEGKDAPEAGKSEDGTVIAQSLTRQVSMIGTFEYSMDRAQLSSLWKLPMNLFFGNGKEDKSVALMIFKPRDAELWDLSGKKGLQFLFGAAKSLVQKKTPELTGDQHEVMKLNRA